MQIQNEPGWIGAFTRDQVAGAIPNGTAIIKVNSETGDAHGDGTDGVILGSISHAGVRNGEICYFVEWGPRPKVAVAVMAFKVKVAELPH